MPSGETPQAIFNETTRTWVGGTSKIAYSTGGTFTTTAIPGNTSYVTSFARDANNHLWIGTSGGGVYDYDNTNFTPYTTTSGLPNNGVNALLSDQLGRIWAGTNNGLAMRAEAGYWLTFTTSTSPIAGNIIEALARDSADRLWIGTANGLSVYNPTAWQHRVDQLHHCQRPARQSSHRLDRRFVRQHVGVDVWRRRGRFQFHQQHVDGLFHHRVCAQHANAGHHRLIRRAASGRRRRAAWSCGRAARGAPSMRRKPRSIRIDWAMSSPMPIGRGCKANTSIAVRGVLTSPIGNFVPAISSFSPISATPGAIVIINGSDFDDRGPEFNVVKFPDSNHFPTLPAEVISATTTSLAVKVPAAGLQRQAASRSQRPQIAVEHRVSFS